MRLRWLLLIRWADDDPNALGRVGGWSIASGAKARDEVHKLSELGTELINDLNSGVEEFKVIDLGL